MPLNQFYKDLPDIGLTALTRSGKDEVFKLLEQMGFRVTRVAFGDIMKENFYRTLPHIPKVPKPIRELQLYGQAMRTLDNDVWVTPTMTRVQHNKNILAQAGIKEPSYIYTDIRQPNEYSAVKSSGAFIVRIESSLETRVTRMLALGEVPTNEVLNAETESYIDSFDVDFTIYNNGSLKELASQVTEMVYQINSKRNDLNE